MDSFLQTLVLSWDMILNALLEDLVLNSHFQTYFFSLIYFVCLSTSKKQVGGVVVYII